MECGEHESRQASTSRGAGGAPGRAPRSSQRTHDEPVSDMDEISYWIYTKRAPCLMNYDRLARRQAERAQGSRPVDAAPAHKKKKKKRKLSILDDDSASIEKQQNVYFEVSSRRVPAAPSSGSSGSDVDFNITGTAPGKVKKGRTQKTLNSFRKDSKLITSTPKAGTGARRSQRRGAGPDEHKPPNESEIVDTSRVSNGHARVSAARAPSKDATEQERGSPSRAEPPGRGRRAKQRSRASARHNGQPDDTSDLSGFTATYIRSTRGRGRAPRARDLLHCVRGGSPASSQDEVRLVVRADKRRSTAEVSSPAESGARYPKRYKSHTDAPASAPGPGPRTRAAARGLRLCAAPTAEEAAPGKYFCR